MGGNFAASSGGALNCTACARDVSTACAGGRACGGDCTEGSGALTGGRDFEGTCLCWPAGAGTAAAAAGAGAQDAAGAG
eukprot:12351050-Alexandrium_andersonii.AAC.1